MAFGSAGGWKADRPARHAHWIYVGGPCSGAFRRWRMRPRDRVFQFGWRGFSLGIGEAGSFPASIKAVAEWFPKRERAMATGIFNSGSECWRDCHAICRAAGSRCDSDGGWHSSPTGALGFLWIAAWLALYRRPEESKLVSPGRTGADSERSRDPVTAKAVPWRTMLTHRGRLGRSASESSSPIRSGGCICSGCRIS